MLPWKRGHVTPNLILPFGWSSLADILPLLRVPLVGCNYLGGETVISLKHQTPPPHHTTLTFTLHHHSTPSLPLLTLNVTLYHHHPCYHSSPSLSPSTIITLTGTLYYHHPCYHFSPSLSPSTIITLTGTLPSSPSLFTLINTAMA